MGEHAEQPKNDSEGPGAEGGTSVELNIPEDVVYALGDNPDGEALEAILLASHPLGPRKRGLGR